MFGVKLFHVLPLCAAFVAPAWGAPEWMTDLEAAQARAAAEGKLVLVDFTGSDWCGSCMSLRKNILDSSAFVAYAQDKFVLLEVDVPRSPSANQEMVRRNKKICEQFAVSIFPTILVITPKGDVVGGFEGGRGGVESVIALLDVARETASVLQHPQLQAAEARLKALHAVYSKLPQPERARSRQRELLLAMDADNLTGIHDEVAAEQQLQECLAKFVAARGNSPAQLAVIDEALKTAYPANRVILLEYKLSLQVELVETLEDIQALKQTYLELAEAKPESTAAMRAQIEEKFADPEALLKFLKANR